MPSTANIAVGMTVAGGSLPAGTTVVSVDSSSQITVSANRSAAIGSKRSAYRTRLHLHAGRFTRTARSPSPAPTPLREFRLAATLGDSSGGGKLSIAKTGPGTWALSGANIYVLGNTTSVSGGRG